MKKLKFSVTKNGKNLNKNLYSWDEKTRTFSSEENDLVLDFTELQDCKFITGWDCTFKTGSGCTFKTGSGCTFDTDSGCTFDTGSGCTFDTDSGCTFDTGSGCTFKTYWDCTFKTGSDCTFKTGSGCTFKTGWDCTFDTYSGCTFDTDSGCTFKTGWDCTFKTGSGCTFKTGSSCTFDTDSGCTFDTGSSCTFDTDSGCTFDTDSGCTFDTGSGCTFKTYGGCTFKTGSGCTFDTDSGCTFKTYWDCTFKTYWDCTFKTGSDCTFTRKDVFEFYNISNKNITLAPYRIKGYVENGYYYIDGERQYPAIIADGILSEIIKQKGNVFKVKNHGEDNISWLIKDSDVYSHGNTLKEARESLIYKISNRDTSMYNDYTLDTVISFEDAIKMYRVITGACEAGTRYFVEQNENKKKDSYAVLEIIELTKGQYNHNKLVEFFNWKGKN